MSKNKYKSDDIFVNNIPTHLEALRKKKRRKYNIVLVLNLKNNLIDKKGKRSKS